MWFLVHLQLLTLTAKLCVSPCLSVRTRLHSYLSFFQSVFLFLRAVQQRTTLSFSLRPLSMCLCPALIQMKSLGPAHTGRSRLPPQRSSCSETKCWSRYFWRWARLPIRLGPSCRFIAHSTLTTMLPMYPAARVSCSVCSGNLHSQSAAHLVQRSRYRMRTVFSLDSSSLPKQMQALHVHKVRSHGQQE